MQRLLLNIAALSLLISQPCLAQDYDSCEFLEGHIPGSPLYHVSLHVHLREPYGPKAANLRDWYIGGLSYFRRNQIRGPIVAGSLKTDRPAKVLGFAETPIAARKKIDRALAVSMVESAIYLKGWLLEQGFPYSGIPIRGVGLTSNSIVKAILTKNNSYQLWSELNYQHVAPGMGKDDPGIPGYTEEPAKVPLIGEYLFWIITLILLLVSVKVIRSIIFRIKLKSKITTLPE